MPTNYFIKISEMLDNVTILSVSTVVRDVPSV